MTSETEPKPISKSETNRSTNVGGNVDAGGDFVGLDKIDGGVVQGDKATVGNISNSTAIAVGTGAIANVTITEETAYNVQGLTNPYLGLRAFSYEDRAIYAGREQLARETVQRLTVPRAQQSILFITGASGSGKSSFAQAGLIPLLESHYAAYGKNVRHAVFRPSSQPMVMLTDTLQKLNRDLTLETLTTHTPQEQVNLLIIDQFEELFIQSEATQRDSFCDFLTNLPAFATSRTHILITLRVDYLDELFEIQPLWTIAKEGVELRTMKADDLRNAIQKPLQVNHPQKRFAPELLDRLVQDASVDAALLPLLQVTLAELWKTGRIVLTNYHSLTDAIRQRADTVFEFSDHEKSDPQSKRSPAEQKELMNILLALINVAADGDDRRDARQRRTRYELEQGSAQCSKLIEEMVNARLLSAASELRNDEDVEVIDIIHESLIVNWDRLKQSIAEQRQQLQRRARFTLWLGEWERNGRQDGALLSDLQLAEARALVEQHDIELQNPVAQEFYTRSWQYLEENRKRELEKQRQLATEQSRRARIFRNAVIVASLLMLIALGLAEWGRRSSILASNNAATATIALATSDASVIEVGKERDRANQEAENAATRAAEAKVAQVDAEQQSKIAFSRQLAAQSASELSKSHYEPALLLAIESGQVTATLESFAAIRAAIANPWHSRTVLYNQTGNFIRAIWSQDGSKVLTSSDEASIWDGATGKELVRFRTHTGRINQATWNQNETKVLTRSNDNTIRIWDATNGRELVKLNDQGNFFDESTWNQNGTKILIRNQDRIIHICDAITGNIVQLEGDTSFAYPPIWNQYGNKILTSSSGGIIRIWNADTGNQLSELYDSTLIVTNAMWNQDETKILLSSSDSTARIWDIGTDKVIKLQGHSDTVLQARWSRDESKILTSSADATARIWDAKTGKPLAKFDGHTGFITQAMWSPDESKVLTRDNDYVVYIWEANTGHTLFTFNASVSAGWNRTGNKILTTSGDGIHIWDANSGEELYKLADHTDTVLQASWNSDESKILTSSKDGTVRIWDTSMVEELIKIDSKYLIYQPTWSRNDKRILARSEDGTVRIWDTASGKQLLAFGGSEPSIVMHAIWSANESKVLINKVDGTASIWDSATGQEVIKFGGAIYPHNSTMWSKNGNKILTANWDKTASIWDAATGEELAKFEGHSSYLTQATWNQGEDTILTLSADVTARIWDVTTAKELIKIEGYRFDIAQATWNKDDSKILTSGADDTARIWDTLTGKELVKLAGHTHHVNQAAWNADESKILTSSNDDTARIWNAISGKELIKFTGHLGDVNQASWNQDESKILTNSDDNTARIWNAMSGEELARITGVYTAVWSRDGDKVVTANWNGTAHIWYVNMIDLLAAGCTRTPRNFTWPEWSGYLEDALNDYRPTCPNAPIPPDAIAGIQDEARQQILAGQVVSGTQRLEELNGWLQVNGQFDSFGVDVDAFVAEVSATATAEATNHK